jgi:hypothetical protein
VQRPEVAGQGADVRLFQFLCGRPQRWRGRRCSACQHRHPIGSAQSSTNDLSLVSYGSILVRSFRMFECIGWRALSW